MLRGGAGDVDVGLDVGDPLAGRDPHHRRRRGLASERGYLGFCCSGAAWIGRALPPWPLERFFAGAREAEEVWRPEGRWQRQRQRQRQAASAAPATEGRVRRAFPVFLWVFLQGLAWHVRIIKQQNLPFQFKENYFPAPEMSETRNFGVPENWDSNVFQDFIYVFD